MLNTLFRTIRILAIPAAVVGGLAFCDLFLLPPQPDSAVITDKSASSGGPGQCMIYAKGQFDYGEAVPRAFYSICDIGDRIELSLTPVFKEWRDVRIVRDGASVARSRGTDISFLALFCVAFFIPALSFVVPSRWTNNKAFAAFAGLLELIALLVLLKFVAVYFGWFQKI
jgi:hypothetical protein